MNTVCEKVVYIQKDGKKVVIDKEEIKAIKFEKNAFELKTVHGNIKCQTNAPYDEVGTILQIFDVTCDDILIKEGQSWEVCRVEKIIGETMDKRDKLMALFERRTQIFKQNVKKDLGETTYKDIYNIMGELLSKLVNTLVLFLMVVFLILISSEYPEAFYKMVPELTQYFVIAIVIIVAVSISYFQKFKKEIRENKKLVKE